MTLFDSPVVHCSPALAMNPAYVEGAAIHVLCSLRLMKVPRAHSAVGARSLAWALLHDCPTTLSTVFAVLRVRAGSLALAPTTGSA